MNSNPREIILLKDFHGFAYGDIAQILEIPKGTVISQGAAEILVFGTAVRYEDQR